MKLSSMFYKDALTFYKLANILSSSKKREQDDQLLLSPILFLLRHSTELLLKALVIKLNENKNENFKIANFIPIHENGNPSKKSLLHIHSLQDLWSFIKFEDKNSRLVSLFNNEEIVLVNN